MTMEVHLLGRPHVRRGGEVVASFRSRKSWALLTYLLLTERPRSRSELAGLLFATAEDPLRALRWSLAEIRRCLGEVIVVDGDPVSLHRSGEVWVDVEVATNESWARAVQVPGLVSELLEGFSISGAPAYEAWLLAERRRLSAAAEAVLHEAAVAKLARQDLTAAKAHALQVVTINPLDEGHQALLIRLYRLAGDEAAAVAQYAACRRLFGSELGVEPGIAVQSALTETSTVTGAMPAPASVVAAVEAGAAAISAGAVATGVESLRSAVWLADRVAEEPLRVQARLVLAEALVHTMRGMDEEGVGALHEVDRLGLAQQDLTSCAHARAELGYVDFLRAHYPRAERWLRDALACVAEDTSIQAKATAYLGSVESDQGNYSGATAHLHQAVDVANRLGDLRQQAYAESMLGRIHLLQGQVSSAREHLERSVELATSDHWLAFVPWPQAFLGECLLRSDPSYAEVLLTQAFARACQLGDPCWEGAAGRGMALLAEARGDVEVAFDVLLDARRRCNRLADAYVWLDVYILDALCALGRAHGHLETIAWVDTMRERASRSGMRELLVRAMLHGASLGRPGDAEAAVLLAREVDNPVLHYLVAEVVDSASEKSETATISG